MRYSPGTRDILTPKDDMPIHRILLAALSAAVFLTTMICYFN
jgi:hypothetical protein